MIYADTETHPFTAAEPIGRLVISSYSDGQNVRLVHRDDPQSVPVLMRALSVGLVMHGGSYDLLAWLRVYPQLLEPMIDALEAGRVHDTLLREKMIDHAYGARTRASRYDLGTVAELRAGLDVDKSDPFRLLYGGLDGVPLEHWPTGAREYAERDALVLAPIYAAQEKHRAVLTDEPRQVRAALALAAQSAHGICTDGQRVATLARLFAGAQTRLERECMDAGLARHKHKRKRPSPIVKSQKQAKEMIAALAAETGQEYLRTPKCTCPGTPHHPHCAGTPALSAEALEQLHVPRYAPCATCGNKSDEGCEHQRTGHPLQAYRALGSLASKCTTYLTPLLQPVTHGSYDPCVETNRTSMYDPNQQNYPRSVTAWIPEEQLPIVSPGYMYPSGTPIKPRPLGFRECLVPRAGHCFVIADWGMMELVCLAQTCLDKFGWSMLAEALRAGRDPHEDMGSAIAGFEIRGHAERKKWRTIAKALNFGFPGGLGAARFVAWAAATYGLTVTEAEAKALKRLWQRTWPEMRLYFDWVGQVTASGAGVIQLERTGYVRGGMGFTDAANFPFQGLAAGAAKVALWRCWVEHMRGHLGAPVLFVHDEIVIESPIEKALDHAANLERIMLGALAETCPDVPGTVETMITSAYTK